jgi:hypothetical protein
MDDDVVLRALSAEVERDDPALAALLSGQERSRHRHSAAWWLLALPLLIPPLVLPARVTLGLLAMILILASPGAVCWLCAVTEGPAPAGPETET